MKESSHPFLKKVKVKAEKIALNVIPAKNMIKNMLGRVNPNWKLFTKQYPKCRRRIFKWMKKFRHRKKENINILYVHKYCKKEKLKRIVAIKHVCDTRSSLFSSELRQKKVKTKQFSHRVPSNKCNCYFTYDLSMCFIPCICCNSKKSFMGQ